MEPIKIVSNNVLFHVYNHKEEAFIDMANDMIDVIKKNNHLNKKTLMIVPVGPIGQYTYFVDRIINERISLKQVTWINMDEYMTSKENLLDENHPLSFRKFMHDEVYHKIPDDLIMPLSQRIFPNPKKLDEVMHIINQHGYVDACYGGIGLNGHVAFNEPIASISKKNFMNLSTRVVQIAKETLVTNAINELDGDYQGMPKYAITIGFKEILMSKKIRLYCFRAWHKSVIKNIVKQRPNTSFPVTLLKVHEDTVIGVTKEILYKEL